MSEYFKRVREKISKLSHEQLKELLDSVSDENEIFTSIFESLSAGLIIVDKSWKLLLANKAAERYLPLSIRLDDAKFETVPLPHLVDDEQIAAFLGDCFENNRLNVSDEFTLVTAGGSIRFVVITVLPLVKKYEMAGAIISVRDITEKRNQEILLRRMENLAGLTNLAAGMAHEIKNPLGAISIHVQLIQKAVKKSRDEDGVLPDKKFIEDHLDVVNEEIDNLNKKVMDFLMAVRPVNAQLALVDVGKILSDAASFIAPEFHNNGIDVQTDISHENMRLLVDEKLFKEVLVNIAQNSLYAIQEKFPECSGERECQTCKGIFVIASFIKDDAYIIAISDNGIGMSEDTAAHIFEPYFTTKANGTGLGMTMAYKIIKEFSGDMQVKSLRGEGTTFTITLPIPQTDKKLLPDNTVQSADDLKINDSEAAQK
ncbi:MAG: PAS domain S-box protein [Treponema sp.]|nr:PAS domain S-box protein [Treponema sp.]